MVNWDTKLETAISDLEVEQKEVQSNLYYIKYKIDGENNFITIATTRPETMLGDSAVAVNPKDQRYKSYIGKKVIIPIINRKVKIIADDYVDQDFAQGCVKITPSHDFNDYEIGERHNLELVTVLNLDGTIKDSDFIPSNLRGLDRHEARKEILRELKNNDLLIKEEKDKMQIPRGDRSGIILEPMVTDQWFVSTESLAKKAIDAVENGDTNYIPKNWEKTYFEWLNNIQDWCISRQIWWGHRIPAWYSDDNIYVGMSEKDVREKYKLDENIKLSQDEDVLDTWFSSALWPFSTFGWPEETEDLRNFYPTTLMVTGFDIIFFWVARMTMMATAFTAQIPFSDVYIHGLVRDEQNRKMSKSAGNGIDPLLLIERYGTDALRFALVREVAGAGQDIRLDFDRKNQTSATVEASRNFANKLWNATRFALINLEDQDYENLEKYDLSKLQMSDKWILSRLARVNHETANRYENYALGEAAKGLYEFAWNDFCDWYLELIKRRLNTSENFSPDELLDQKIAKSILYKVLSDLLIMLHPLMPHLTEELWHGLTGLAEDQFLALQPWPKLNEQDLNIDLESSFSDLFASIRLIRNLRAVAGLKPSQKVPVMLVSGKEVLQNTLQTSINDIAVLTKAKEVQILSPEQAKSLPSMKALAGVSGELEVVLPIEGLIDIASLRSRLEKDLNKAQKEIESLSGRLANKNFVDKAPKEVVEECRANLRESEAQVRLVKQRLMGLD